MDCPFERSILPLFPEHASLGLPDFAAERRVETLGVASGLEQRIALTDDAGAGGADVAERALRALG
ncbi:MAG: hypothetical protein ACO4AV_11505, partial [bacterium]